MTENLIKALLSMRSVKEMRAHLKVRRKGRRHVKRDEGEDSDEHIHSRGWLWRTASSWG